MASLTRAVAILSAHLAWAVPNICGQNATLGNAIIASVNLSYSAALAPVAAAAARGDLDSACDALAAYYAACDSGSWLRVPPVTPGNGSVGGLTDRECGPNLSSRHSSAHLALTHLALLAFLLYLAELVEHDFFYLAGVDLGAVVPRNSDGGIDWLDKGPRTDVEFMNCLNRHDSFVALLSAWNTTGNPKYSTYFNALVQDWVAHLPCPDALSGGAKCVPDGLPGLPCAWAGASVGSQACATGTMESPWRSLEMGIRMGGQWPAAFYGFQTSPDFTTSARVLMLLAVAEHNSALVVDGGHPGSGTVNWEITQWQGLVTSCAAFPELRNSSDHLALAISHLTTILDSGVYPDGVETELASGYDMVTAGDYVSGASTARVPPSLSCPSPRLSSARSRCSATQVRQDPTPASSLGLRTCGTTAPWSQILKGVFLATAIRIFAATGT
jgi:hypothetical protein